MIIQRRNLLVLVGLAAAEQGPCCPFAAETTCVTQRINQCCSPGPIRKTTTTNVPTPGIGAVTPDCCVFNSNQIADLTSQVDALETQLKTNQIDINDYNNEILGFERTVKKLETELLG